MAVYSSCKVQNRVNLSDSLIYKNLSFIFNSRAMINRTAGCHLYDKKMLFIGHGEHESRKDRLNCNEGSNQNSTLQSEIKSFSIIYKIERLVSSVVLLFHLPSIHFPKCYLKGKFYISTLSVEGITFTISHHFKA